MSLINYPHHVSHSPGSHRNANGSSGRKTVVTNSSNGQNYHQIGRTTRKQLVNPGKLVIMLITAM